MPQRVQLRRRKGWRKPEGAVVVARPSRWGNPYRVGTDGDPAQCVELFRRALHANVLAISLDDVRRDLAGHDLACWCPLDESCHADVLLNAANGRTDIVIAVDDPRVDDVRALLNAHLKFSHAVTPVGHVHALDLDGLLDNPHSVCMTLDLGDRSPTLAP